MHEEESIAASLDLDEEMSSGFMRSNVALKDCGRDDLSLNSNQRWKQ